MKASTKRTLSNLGLSLFNNERAIEGAKTAPWWIAVILFVIGTFLPVIPIMVSQGKTYGSEYLSGYVYGYDQQLTSTFTSIANDNYKFKIQDQQLLAYKDDTLLENTSALDANDVSKDLTPIGTYTVSETVDSSTFKTRKLNVFYSDRPFSGKSNGDFTIANMIKKIEATQYVLNQPEVTIYTQQDEFASASKYIPSYLILFKTGFYSCIYKTNTTTKGTASYTGNDWKKFENTDDFLGNILKVEGVTADVHDANYVKGVMNNWKLTANKAYENQKVSTFWMVSGIFYGIFVGLTIFMGLMLFLLTRGKNNPNRGLRFDTCEWIAGWIVLSPAILAMIVGFIFPMAQQVAFIVLIGLRTMWLAMRQLNPRY